MFFCMFRLKLFSLSLRRRGFDSKERLAGISVYAVCFQKALQQRAQSGEVMLTELYLARMNAFKKEKLIT